ncbi:hypothetical protein [uncultured Roseobacter sp.]|uniref:hypothetical protein n=1 Tax=uncultured Roseobacter sp. TaxID=114847 RepID=UPI0026125292|nr:hypothetical protein [uncultured Roseobacter sp.]
MPKFRSRISGLLPRRVLPFFKRQVRQFDRLRGLPAARNRPGVVLMLHVGRCGSTVLANLLGQNPDVYWDGKLPRKAKQLYGDSVRKFDYAAWTKAQFAISGDRFYGFEFKILADQYPAVFGTNTAEFLSACQRIGVTHYILLTRRNTLRHVVSHYASKSRGNWHAGAGETVKKKEFTLDIDGITTGGAPGRPIVEYLQEVETAHDQVRSLLADQPFLEIEYERDIDAGGAEQAYGQICSFLGIEPGEVHIQNRKMNPFPLDTVLINYGEVAEALAGTKFAWMARDDEAVERT